MSFFIYDEITNRTLQELTNYLNENEKIEIHINSGGGNVFSGIAIYNLLKNKNAEIIVEGFCASAATLILCAGNVTAATGSLFMIHNPATILFDFYTADELEKLKNSLDMIKNSVLDIYCTKMKISRDEISKMMDAETWLTADEVLQIGLIDKIENLGDVEMSETGKQIMDRFKNSVLVAERARVAALTALKNDSPAVNSVINLAIENGDTTEKILPYVNAIKNADSLNLKYLNQMKADNENSGAENITAEATFTDAEKSKMQAANIAKFANELMGGVQK